MIIYEKGVFTLNELEEKQYFIVTGKSKDDIHFRQTLDLAHEIFGEAVTNPVINNKTNEVTFLIALHEVLINEGELFMECGPYLDNCDHFQLFVNFFDIEGVFIHEKVNVYDIRIMPNKIWASRMEGFGDESHIIEKVAQNRGVIDCISVGDLIYFGIDTSPSWYVVISKEMYRNKTKITKYNVCRIKEYTLDASEWFDTLEDLLKVYAPYIKQHLSQDLSV